MTLVMASELDPLAPKVVEAWPRGKAVLLTPRDLCRRGWHLHLGGREAFSLVAEGVIWDSRALSGVLNLLAHVPEHELFTIEESHRRYVAAELNAMLAYFLTELRCPVLNRPTPHHLIGPDWRHEQWVLACRSSGLKTAKTRRDSDDLSSDSIPAKRSSISVIGDECVGDLEAAPSSAVRYLARLAGVEFLTAHFTEHEGERVFASAQLVPNLEDPQVLAALHSYLTKA